MNRIGYFVGRSVRYAREIAKEFSQARERLCERARAAHEARHAASGFRRHYRGAYEPTYSHYRCRHRFYRYQWSRCMHTSSRFKRRPLRILPFTSNHNVCKWHVRSLPMKAFVATIVQGWQYPRCPTIQISGAVPSLALSKPQISEFRPDSLYKFMKQSLLKLGARPIILEARRSLARQPVFRLRLPDPIFSEGAWALEPPSLASAVDFDLRPQIALPLVNELSDRLVDDVQQALRAQATELEYIYNDIRKLAELGELPVSLENNGSVIRVHFPNRNVHEVAALLEEKEVTRGRIVEVPAPAESLPDSPESSLITSPMSGWSSVSSLPGLSETATTISTLDASLVTVL